MIGGGFLLNSVAHHVRALGAEDDFLLAGAADALQTKQLLNFGDIMMMTSESEGTPLALFEAMSMGLPVIAPAVGGIPEMVTSTMGILVPTEGLELQEQVFLFPCFKI